MHKLHFWFSMVVRLGMQNKGIKKIEKSLYNTPWCTWSPAADLLPPAGDVPRADGAPPRRHRTPGK